ncbi:FAD-dependent thymidylate synthase [Peptoniphilus vaginalis]|uniref:FAD-dependent thymidylate synthase n=1 Tax=Peptoniphilus vaginalis TaxID=1756987 RepID=UPI0023F68CF3|nr:FAD-dependent thymidylate synthase [Peptoniphilus vaginalis]
MRIGKQKVELLYPQSYEELTEKIEIAGRVCYQSEPKGDPEKFIRMIIKRGHESVLEHGSLTFKIRTNRAIANEIVRHRLASYSQESTRYVKYDDIEFIPGDRLEESYAGDMLTKIEEAYNFLIGQEFKPEEARDILPNATATTLVMTMNFRELRHFLKLRLDKAAHPQIRELARIILGILKDEYPVFVEDIER